MSFVGLETASGWCFHQHTHHTSLVPRHRGGGIRKSTWYTLFMHPLNHYGIPWQLCSHVYIHTLVGACVNSVNQVLPLPPSFAPGYEANIIQGRALET